MQSPWSLGKTLALVSLILSLVILLLCVLTPGVTVHLAFASLFLLALLSFAVVLM